MKTILIIEDNSDIRTNIAEILELSNYTVIAAENGKAGLKKALAYLPDLIICDIMMPLLDGYGVLHALHKNESIKNTPFIFLTSKSERSEFRKGMELGADDYIIKPFDATDLLNAVESRLNKFDLLKQEFSNGMEGVHQLMDVSPGKQAIGQLIINRSANKYKKKQTVYTEGNHPGMLYYVLKGKIKTFRTNEDGKELVCDLFMEGDFLGYVALLQQTVYRDTAEALENTELALIPKEAFDDLINKNRHVANKFIQLLAKNVSDKEQQLLGMAYNSLRKKVADTLLWLLHKYPDNEENFIIEIGRESLASIAGTATESLIRTLSDFRTEKIVDIKDGNIIISNKQKLENMVN